ncbi:hypothetical protein CMEL01_05223 [Colletotrichum melonis]|uniref:Uncharacterized protein n=1 Tax=Colletotrichum melonis TaxID=1209925 RepID=A0AAI9UAU0_9PEZI|nr:hypothetical protein CMEL01_05223 [Colletotrichum melonis]
MQCSRAANKIRKPVSKRLRSPRPLWRCRNCSAKTALLLFTELVFGPIVYERPENLRISVESPPGMSRQRSCDCQISLAAAASRTRLRDKHRSYTHNVTGTKKPNQPVKMIFPSCPTGFGFRTLQFLHGPSKYHRPPADPGLADLMFGHQSRFPNRPSRRWSLIVLAFLLEARLARFLEGQGKRKRGIRPGRDKARGDPTGNERRESLVTNSGRFYAYPYTTKFKKSKMAWGRSEYDCNHIPNPAYLSYNPLTRCLNSGSKYGVRGSASWGFSKDQKNKLCDIRSCLARCNPKRWVVIT